MLIMKFPQVAGKVGKEKWNRYQITNMTFSWIILISCKPVSVPHLEVLILHFFFLLLFFIFSFFSFTLTFSFFSFSFPSFFFLSFFKNVLTLVSNRQHLYLFLVNCPHATEHIGYIPREPRVLRKFHEPSGGPKSVSAEVWKPTSLIFVRTTLRHNSHSINPLDQPEHPWGILRLHPHWPSSPSLFCFPYSSSMVLLGNFLN